MSKIFTSLSLWRDQELRTAAENMAVDEWLLEGRIEDFDVPILRFYHWEKSAVTIGYFQPNHLAQMAIDEGYDCSRRLTGGGRVTHGEGIDITYSLLVPAGHPLYQANSSRRYCLIHRALCSALQKFSSGCFLSKEMAETVSGELNGQCFIRPVEADVMAQDGSKLAGAAQRRRKAGLLHQGSIAVSGLGCRVGDVTVIDDLAEDLAGELSESFSQQDFIPPKSALSHLLQERYTNEQWLFKQPVPLEVQSESA